MHRRHHIIRPERGGGADRDRLVSALAERAADPASRLPIREHPFVERPRELHPVVEGELCVGRHDQ